MSFWRALQVLTRVPTRLTADPGPDWLARAAAWFPLVGIGVGALSGGVFWLARIAWVTGPIPAVLAIATGVLITGGLHEDGLADVADGLGAGRDVETRLRIMKDSHIGSYGVLALVLVIAAKAAALSSLTALQGLAVLVAAHGLARAGCTLTMATLAYVSPKETSKFGSMGRPALLETILALATGILALVFMPWDAILACLATAALAGLGVGLMARAKLGGYTGDVLGAVEQAVEVAVLLAASVTVGGFATVATTGHVQ